MMNRFAKLAGITGLTALTVMSSLGLGTVNVLADDAKLPAYVMDGTNAERAISDFFVNNYNLTNENSVVIPHMDVMKTQDNGSSLNVYGAYTVVEYTKDGSALVENSSAATEGCFTLNRNQDGTFTVASYNAVRDDASKGDVVEVFGEELGDEAFAIYCNNGGTDLWNAILAEDAAYYSYDNSLGLDRIVGMDDAELSLANVSFSTNGAHTMYIQEDANVRSAGTKVATAFDGICKGESITVTGMANGWGRVTMDGRTGYISASLLGDTKPTDEQKDEVVRTSYTCGKLIATTLLTHGDPMEGVAIAPDGRVADTGNNYGRGYDDVVINEDGDPYDQVIINEDGDPYDSMNGYDPETEMNLSE